MRRLALIVALGALASCSPFGIAGDAAVGAAQLGLSAAQTAVGVVDLAI